MLAFLTRSPSRKKQNVLQGVTLTSLCLPGHLQRFWFSTFFLWHFLLSATGHADLALTELFNDIDTVGKGRFQGSWRGQVSVMVLLAPLTSCSSSCHLFIRQSTRKSDILYTHSVVAFGFALCLWVKEVWINGMIFIWLNWFGSLRPSRHPVWLSLSFQVSHQGGRKARLIAALHSKLHFKRKRGKSERWCHSSAWCECQWASGSTDTRSSSCRTSSNSML